MAALLLVLLMLPEERIMYIFQLASSHAIVVAVARRMMAMVLCMMALVQVWMLEQTLHWTR